MISPQFIGYVLEFRDHGAESQSLVYWVPGRTGINSFYDSIRSIREARLWGPGFGNREICKFD
ncbi:hypothetical protein SAMN05421757_11729 [Tropicimonas sediminicola]|uniref:Uncharacterized protein n=1 Tax=Tropicimonas sediminicola TaxID=1031541 RepID=A0A239MFI7_9RHOB|nr:hypothetical protein SAMN05421757_11729 [Tropicimonas sediminicola]